MRIVAGIWRGRRIKAPKGTSTRPTSDRVREALFSSLISLAGSFEGVRVLDPYAGSGALGLEALSRGANHVTFVESDRIARAILDQNIADLGAGLQATVHSGDAGKILARGVISEPVSLLLLDPPYRIDKSEVRTLIDNLVLSQGLMKGAIVVWEHATGEIPEWPSTLRPYSNRTYGSTEIDIAIVKED